MEESKNHRNNLFKSTRIPFDTKEEGKKELLQYRIVDNDSDGEVIEGLGNTTIISRRDNIDAGDSSDEAGVPQDNNNIQS